MCTRAVEPERSFRTTDTDIWAYVELENVRQGDLFRVRWINPNGIEEAKHLPHTNGYAGDSNWALMCAVDTLTRGGRFAGSNYDHSPAPGRWEARLEVGSRTRSEFFTVRPSTCRIHSVTRLTVPPVSYPDGNSLNPVRAVWDPRDDHYQVSTDHGCVWSAVSGVPWVMIVHTCRNVTWDVMCDDLGGSGPGYVTVRWNEELAGGARSATILVADQAVTVIPSRAVSATGATSDVAPGSILTVTWAGACPPATSAASPTWPTLLAGYSFRLDGVPLPIHYVGQGGGPNTCQINTQVPWYFTPERTYTGVVVGPSSATVSVRVSAFAPSFFVAPPDYPVLLQIADRGYTLMSAGTPVYPGETLVGYPDGFGQTTPARVTGQPIAGSTLGFVNAMVEAWIKSCLGTACDYLPANVLYTIAYPGSPAAYQMAVTVPSLTVDAGRRYALVVKVGGKFVSDMPLEIANRP